LKEAGLEQLISALVETSSVLIMVSKRHNTSLEQTQL